ncbi:MAG TPA: RNA polymerase sigma-70 factor [Pricia sp.]|nr:RNA polymerase sigma-70 factor [Pricia sp.]
MQKVKDSDQKAFRELYNILWKPLYVRVFTILRNRQVCEDILQEVWIDLWQRRKDIENENIEAYLFRAVRFKAYNHYRNATTRRTILQNLLATRESIHKNDVEESVNLKETERAVMSLIDTLPPKCKRVFELSRLEGLKNREISQKLNISKSTVENHISNALKVLKAHIASLVLTAGWFLLYL